MPAIQAHTLVSLWRTLDFGWLDDEGADDDVLDTERTRPACDEYLEQGHWVYQKVMGTFEYTLIKSSDTLESLLPELKTYVLTVFKLQKVNICCT